MRIPGNQPIVVRIFEVTKSTDKKKKDAMLTEIARARADLLPLLQGAMEFDADINAETLVCAPQASAPN